MTNSLPTVEQANLDQFWNVIRQLDPELYLIKIALSETKVNPEIIPRVIRNISNLYTGTGFGRIQIFMQKRIITAIKGEESDLLDLEAAKD